MVNKQSHNLFHVEPDDSNVLQCYICGIDTFNYWVSEDKKSSLTFTCLTWSLKFAEQLRTTHNKVKFYYKYEDEDLDNLFKRLEGKIFDPDYIDTGLQIKLLLKTDWPEVRTKQDLVEEHLPCVFYDGKNMESSLYAFARTTLTYFKYREQNNNLTRSKIEIYKNESLSEQSVQSEPPKPKKRVRKMKKKQEEESEDYEESEESKDSEEFKPSLARTTEKGNNAELRLYTLMYSIKLTVKSKY